MWERDEGWVGKEREMWERDVGTGEGGETREREIFKGKWEGKFY